MAENIDIFCAQPTGGQVIPTVNIRIAEPIPEIPVDESSTIYLRKHRDMYTCQAKMLSRALCHSLPGGTLDALLVDLLDRKRSLFRVPLFTEEKGANENEV